MEIPTYLLDPYWWASSIIAGVVASLLAFHFNRYFSYLSARLACRRNTYAAGRRRKIEILRTNPHLQVLIAHSITHAFLRALFLVLFLVLVVALLVFGKLNKPSPFPPPLLLLSIKYFGLVIFCFIFYSCLRAFDAAALLAAAMKAHLEHLSSASRPPTTPTTNEPPESNSTITTISPTP